MGRSRIPFLTIVFLFCSSVVFLSSNWSNSNPCKSSNQTLCYPATPILKQQNLADICRNYNWTVPSVESTNYPLPIYDFILFAKEFDVLEIRLHEMYDYVMFFLIAESRRTFTGKDKPLYLKENWDKFAKFHDKIIRVEVELMPNVSNPWEPWENEKLMRDVGLRLALENLGNSIGPFMLITSDTDEIPKAQFLNALKHCELPEVFIPRSLQCDFYYYSYEFPNLVHFYYGPTVSRVNPDELKSVSAHNLRIRREILDPIPRSCFHCTWCFDQLKQVLFKMAAYSHTEHNQVQFRTREHILDHYRHGKDLFDRPKEKYGYIANNQDLPKLLKAQPDRFMFMIRRVNLTNVGFIDA